MQIKYTDAYKSIKATDEMKAKILACASTKRSFNYKGLISVAACVIILAALFPAYVGFTDPDITVSDTPAMTQRAIGTSISLELDLKRTSVIEVTEGTLEDYNGDKIKGNTHLMWDIGTADYKTCKLILKDAFKTTEYVLNYNENNDSWSIINN